MKSCRSLCLVVVICCPCRGRNTRPVRIMTRLQTLLRRYIQLSGRCVHGRKDESSQSFLFFAKPDRETAVNPKKPLMFRMLQMKIQMLLSTGLQFYIRPKNALFFLGYFDCFI